MDFHGYAEVYPGGQWLPTDARFHVPRIGRIKISCGLDAVDGAFFTIYGGASPSYFQGWAYQVERGKVGGGDPLDFSLRLDNRHEIFPRARPNAWTSAYASTIGMGRFSAGTSQRLPEGLLESSKHPITQNRRAPFGTQRLLNLTFD